MSDQELHKMMETLSLDGVAEAQDDNYEEVATIALTKVILLEEIVRRIRTTVSKL